MIAVSWSSRAVGERSTVGLPGQPRGDEERDHPHPRRRVQDEPGHQRGLTRPRHRLPPRVRLIPIGAPARQLGQLVLPVAAAQRGEVADLPEVARTAATTPGRPRIPRCPARPARAALPYRRDSPVDLSARPPAPSALQQRPGPALIRRKRSAPQQLADPAAEARPIAAAACGGWAAVAWWT